jgi:hypothetical protein
MKPMVSVTLATGSDYAPAPGRQSATISEVAELIIMSLLRSRQPGIAYVQTDISRIDRA